MPSACRVDGVVGRVVRRSQHVGAACIRDEPHAGGKDLEGVTAGRGEHGGGDLGGCRGPGLPPARLAVEPRIVDRNPGRRGQGGDELLVVEGERAGGRIGEVEVAEHLVANPHGYTEEAVHRRMMGRKAHRPGVGRELAQPDRPRVVDEGAEHTVTLGEMPDDLLVPSGHPDVDELLEPAVGTDHPERTVLGADEVDGDVDDALEDDGQIEVLDNRLIGGE